MCMWVQYHMHKGEQNRVNTSGRGRTEGRRWPSPQCWDERFEPAHLVGVLHPFLCLSFVAVIFYFSYPLRALATKPLSSIISRCSIPKGQRERTGSLLKISVLLAGSGGQTCVRHPCTYIHTPHICHIPPHTPPPPHQSSHKLPDIEHW